MYVEHMLCWTTIYYGQGGRPRALTLFPSHTGDVDSDETGDTTLVWTWRTVVRETPKILRGR